MVFRRVRVALTSCIVASACGGGSPSEDANPGSGGGGVAGAPVSGGSSAVAGGGAAGVALGGAGAASVAGRSTVGGGAGALASGGAAGGAGSPAGGGGTSNAGNGGRAGAGTSGSGGRVGSSGAGGGGAAGTAGNGMAGGSACAAVGPVPAAVRSRLALDAFYEKHIDANGLPVIASSAPADESLILACKLLINMLSERDDVRQELIRRKARFAIIGKNEGTADIPEYGYRDGPQADIDYINQRARGLGGLVASCGEENILCLDGDRYNNESICVHEFSHTITTYGAYTADESFQDDLQDAYDAALASGILDQTYRSSNIQEYWAEGVQDWYDTNASANPPNGVHNQVDTREELEPWDPALYALVSGMFPDDTGWGDCHVMD